jgi:hypothetical protein
MILWAVRSNDCQARSGWGVTNMVSESTLTVSRMRTGQLRMIRWRTGQGRGYVCMTCGSVERDTIWYVCY